MKSVTVSLSRQLPNGDWKKIEWVDDVDDDYETHQSKTKELNDGIEIEFHKLVNYKPQDISNATDTHYNELIETLTPTPKTQEEKFANLIQSATTEKELTMYKNTAYNPKYPSLKNIYDNKLKELTNK